MPIGTIRSGFGLPDSLVKRLDKLFAKTCATASIAYQEALQRHVMLCSMSRRGDCWDNSVAESFFATLKEELIYRDTWPTRIRARLSIVEYIECFYNSYRRHSAAGDRSPLDYELGAMHYASAA